MKGKYITYDILLACLSHRKPNTSIHDQLEATIAEHRRIKQQFFKGIDTLLQPGSKKDIHQELAATIAAMNPTIYPKYDEAA